jgi:hypothetical protein
MLFKQFSGFFQHCDNTYNNDFNYSEHSYASSPVIQIASFLSTVVSKVIYK